MKFHFDSYVKNWKRKKVEPATKKQKLENEEVGDENGDEVEDEEDDPETIAEKLKTAEPGKAFIFIKGVVPGIKFGFKGVKNSTSYGNS